MHNSRQLILIQSMLDLLGCDFVQQEQRAALEKQEQGAWSLLVAGGRLLKEKQLLW